MDAERIFSNAYMVLRVEISPEFSRVLRNAHSSVFHYEKKIVKKKAVALCSNFQSNHWSRLAEGQRSPVDSLQTSRSRIPIDIDQSHSKSVCQCNFIRKICKFSINIDTCYKKTFIHVSKIIVKIICSSISFFRLESLSHQPVNILGNTGRDVRRAISKYVTPKMMI